MPPRTRLDPAVFRLPVDRIRSGWYTDAYFNLTKHLLEAEDRHPTVLMQVFQKQDSVLGGIDGVHERRDGVVEHFEQGARIAEAARGRNRLARDLDRFVHVGGGLERAREPTEETGSQRGVAGR